MKDIQSSLGGSTYPAETDEAGIVKGVVVRNKGSYGRRIGILTSGASITAGPTAHGADYAYEPIAVETLPEGYTAGVELELSPAREYHKVFEVTGFFASRNIGILETLGAHPDLVGYGEMSNKVAGLASETEKLGQVTTTSELRQLERGAGNYLFSLSIHNRGKIYHLGFDGLKHAARLTADLNYQLRKVMPGAVGYFTLADTTPGQTQNGEIRPRQILTLYMSVKPEQGDLAFMAYRIPNYNLAIALGDSLLPSTPFHINNELTNHITVNNAGVTTTDPSGEFVTSYRDEVLPDAQDLIEAAVTMQMPGVFRDEGDHYLWEPVVDASLFKSYPADPRYRIAVLKLNYPGSLSLTGLKLKGMTYKLISGDRKVDLLPVRSEYHDGSVERVAPSTVFTGVGDNNVEFISKPSGLTSELDFEFGELGGDTATLVNIRDRDLPEFYVAVIVPPEDLNDVPMFRKAESVTLSIVLEKVTYPRHQFDTPPKIQKTWDAIYTTLDQPLPLPNLTGTLAPGAGIEQFMLTAGSVVSYPNAEIVDGEVKTNGNVTYQELLDHFGYVNDFPMGGSLTSSHVKDTLTLGFVDNVAFEMNLTYPPTNLSLSGFGEIVYAKGNPNNNMNTPLFINGTILGGFPNAPLKHATTVEWEFFIVDGTLITPTEDDNLPLKGALTKAVNVGFDKAIFEALDDTEHFLTVKLTARYPWIQNPVEATVQIPISTSIYVPPEGENEVKQYYISATLPENVEGIEIYDLDTNETVLAIESLYDINTGAYWDAMETAGVQVTYPGRDENPDNPA